MDIVNGFGGDDKGSFLEFGSWVVFPELLDKKDLFRRVKKLEKMRIGEDLRWRRG